VSHLRAPTGIGTFTTSGLYTAPAAIAATQTLTVTATSVFDPTNIRWPTSRPTTPRLAVSAQRLANLGRGAKSGPGLHF
jgi:hypothetical protein